jgi:hypothetical protein
MVLSRILFEGMRNLLVATEKVTVGFWGSNCVLRGTCWLSAKSTTDNTVVKKMQF